MWPGSPGTPWCCCPPLGGAVLGANGSFPARHRLHRALILDAPGKRGVSGAPPFLCEGGQFKLLISGPSSLPVWQDLALPALSDEVKPATWCKKSSLPQKKCYTWTFIYGLSAGRGRQVLHCITVRLWAHHATPGPFTSNQRSSACAPHPVRSDGPQETMHVCILSQQQHTEWVLLCPDPTAPSEQTTLSPALSRAAGKARRPSSAVLSRHQVFGKGSVSGALQSPQPQSSTGGGWCGFQASTQAPGTFTSRCGLFDMETGEKKEGVLSTCCGLATGTELGPKPKVEASKLWINLYSTITSTA